MNEAERNAFDIKSYLPFFRKFYLFLGISLFLIGFALNYLISANAAITFLAIYPIVAHFYSLSKSASYYKGMKPKKYTLAYIVLGSALLLVVILMATGNLESELIFNSDKIEITGMYGEVLTRDEVKSFELVEDLPEIGIRTNGFSSGNVNKGYFDTKNKENVKLILNSDQRPVLLIITSSGKKIYYSASKKSNETIFKQLQNTFPSME